MCLQGLSVVLANIYGLLTLVPNQLAQLMGALLFGSVRTMQWSCYFHFLALPSRYPIEMYGRLLGYGNIGIALAGDGIPYLLARYVTDLESQISDQAVPASIGSNVTAWLSADTATGRYTLINFALQVIMLACIALPLHLRHTRLLTSGTRWNSRMSRTPGIVRKLLGVIFPTPSLASTDAARSTTAPLEFMPSLHGTSPAGTSAPSASGL